MMVPGSNLLNMALKVIQPQTVSYYQFNGRALNSIGYQVATYLPPVVSPASLQPIKREMYANMGLDLQKDYCMVFISKGVLDVDRDISGDVFIYSGMYLQCVSITNWFRQDGWDAVLCVKIPAAPFVATVTPPEDGNYEEGDTLDFTLTFTGPVTVTGAPYIPLTIGAIGVHAVYVSGTTSLLFRYTVTADDEGALSAASPVVGNLGAANYAFIPPDLTGVTINE